VDPEDSPIIQRFIAQHAPFLHSAAGVTNLAAQRTTILAIDGRDDRVYQICQVIFDRKQGSIYVQFPYFPTQAGTVGAVEFDVSAEGTSTISLASYGQVTSHLVKYSHPPDGRAHFSQDGRIVSAVRRQSIPLSEVGHLFEVHAYDPSAFRELKPGEEKKGRLYAPFVFVDGLPSGLTVAAEWRTRAEVHQVLAGAPLPVGPVVVLPRRWDRQPFQAMLLGQPPGFPLQEHFLTLNVGATRALPSVRGPIMIFMGGWSPGPRRVVAGSRSGCLAFLYPDSTPEDVRRRLGSVDYSPPAGG